MSTKQEHFRIAVLDDYQRVALSLADWSVLDARATVTVFNDHLADSDAAVERLQPFDIVCVMRERTPMTRTIIERLPKLRMIASTAPRNASIDLKAAEERGVQVVHTGYTSAPPVLPSMSLIRSRCRSIIRSARWRTYWPRHTSVTSRAAFTPASIRTRSRNVRRWLDGQATG
jgi:hypothetical protein